MTCNIDSHICSGVIEYYGNNTNLGLNLMSLMTILKLIHPSRRLDDHFNYDILLHQCMWNVTRLQIRRIIILMALNIQASI